MDHPFNLTVDKAGRVYLIDWCNKRMLVLDSELKQSKVVFKDDIFEPRRLHCMADTERLMIGYGNGKVDLYSISSVS